MTITCLRARLLSSPHGFLGRTGGVSLPPYDSLNMGAAQSDVLAHVMENRQRGLAVALPQLEAPRLVLVDQVHGAQVVQAEVWDAGAAPQADALVTDRPGLALGILTADCAPLLLEDSAAGVIGAAHAGWRGALGGVIAATVVAMEQLGADRQRLRAAVGPCIGRRSYEVDLAFRKRFEEADPDNAAFFTDARTGHALFDLEGYCLAQLAAAGVGKVQALGADTLADAVHFFSHRRSSLTGDSRTGRQLSVITLPER